MISIKEAKYLNKYQIGLIFSDNKHAVISLYNTIFNDHRRIFQELRDIEEFKKFTVKMDTIVWDNGLDLAPEYLYEHSLPSSH